MQIAAVDQLRVGHHDQRLDVHLQNAASIARHGLTEARRSVKALRPSELDLGSLTDALKLVARLAEQQSGVSVVVQCDAGARFQPAQAAEILRIVQEAMTNAVKHARATLISVSCRNERAHSLLSIVDNGAGFDPERKTEGFGLVGMRERAAKIGGELRVNSGSNGTSIDLTIPFSRDTS
jgi:signal transduction histidine kinase